MIAILLLVGVITLLYYLVFKNKDYWSRRNVQTGHVTPIIGDGSWLFLGRENFASLINRLYNKIEDTRYIGVHYLGEPALLIKSPELIKQMCVKNSDHFVDHLNFVPEGVDEFWSGNLFFLKGQSWKNMRSTVSPTFTSSKMKSMFVFMCQNAETFVKYFLDKNEEIVEIEAKDAFTRYTSDIIANVAFGIQIDSLKDRENEFFTLGKEATDFNNFCMVLKIFCYKCLPSVAALFRLKFLPHKVRHFFHTVVKDQIAVREECKIRRADILGLLLEARSEDKDEKREEYVKDVSFAAVEEHLEMKKSERNLTDSEITAQLLIFFFGGYETMSLSMCFLAQELAENPDVQKRLIEEIDENRSENGTPTYDTIANMTYMDMVISENLRKWPVNIATDRVCTKPFTIQPENPGEQPLDILVKDNILIPIFGIHRDPKYFPDPEKFDPERFSTENRQAIQPYTYLPFGAGPRNCVGSRFALLEIKTLFFHVLSHFEIVPIGTTHVPLRLKKNTFNYAAEGGFNLGLKRRRQ